MDIEFVNKIDSYIYGHHPGHFFHPDSDAKLTLHPGTRMYSEIFYDITHSLPEETNKKSESCSFYEGNYSLDNCFLDVSLNHFLMSNKLPVQVVSVPPGIM